MSEIQRGPTEGSMGGRRAVGLGARAGEARTQTERLIPPKGQRSLGGR